MGKIVIYSEQVESGTPAPARSALMKPQLAPSKESKPRWYWIILSVALAAVGIVGGWLIFRVHKDVMVIDNDLTVFAGLFVLAAAIERLLEPFTNLFAPSAEKKKKELAASVVNAAKSDRELAETVVEAAQRGSDEPKEPPRPNPADAQVALNQVRTERGYVLWGLATGVAGVTCGGAGMFLLNIVAKYHPPPRLLDLAITALVVGSGTKPLHDLISGIEKKKTAQEDPTQTGGW